MKKVTTQGLEDYLQSKGLPIKRRSGDELITDCLFCDDRKAHLYFNSKTGLYHCKKCGAKGNGHTLLAHFGDKPSHRLTSEERSQIEHRERVGEVLNATADYYHQNLTSEARKYLDDRGLADTTIEKFKIGWADGNLRGYLADKFPLDLCIKAGVLKKTGGKLGVARDYFHHRIIFPSFKRDRVVHLTGRRILDGPEPKWLHLPGPIDHLYNDDALIEAKEVIIAEGIPDCLILVQLGYPAVGVLGAGGFKESWIGKFNNVEIVYLALDEDKAGESGMLKIASLMPQKTRIVRFWPRKTEDTLIGDINEAYLADPEGFKKWLDKLPEEAKNIFQYKIDRISATGLGLSDKLLPILKEATDVYNSAKIEELLRYTKERFSLSAKDIEAYRKELHKYRKEGEKQAQEPVIIRQLITNELQEITPAQDFLDGVAYTTVPLRALTSKGATAIPYLVTSNRECIELNHENLLDKGLYTTRIPDLPYRWSKESMERYLKGETNVNIAEVFAMIREQYQFYVDIEDPRYYDYLAAWVIVTYFHRLFEACGYINLVGNLESGKTKTLTLSSLLAFNGELTFNSTPAYIIEIIHANHSTCCVDEVEKLQRVKDNDSQTVINMYNAGYKKGAFVGKKEQDAKGNWRAKRFEAYGPKMFAGIKGLDPTLASRSTSLTMVRSNDKQIKNREIDLRNPLFQQLRDQLYIVMLTYHQEVEEAKKELKDNQIVGREWEIWKPLLAISSVVDSYTKLGQSGLYRTLRELALDAFKAKQSSALEDTVLPKLLLSLRELVTEDRWYSTSEIKGHLISYDEETFGWLRESNRPGRFIGDELKRAGIIDKPAIPKKIDGRTVKGYNLKLAIIVKRIEGLGIECM